MGSDVLDEVIARCADLEIGLADASLVVLVRRHGVADVLTLHERHFRALRIAGRKRFKLCRSTGRIAGASLKNVVTLLNASPGKYRYASAGKSSPLHLAAERGKLG